MYVNYFTFWLTFTLTNRCHNDGSSFLQMNNIAFYCFFALLAIYTHPTIALSYFLCNHLYCFPLIRREGRWGWHVQRLFAFCFDMMLYLDWIISGTSECFLQTIAQYVQKSQVPQFSQRSCGHRWSKSNDVATRAFKVLPNLYRRLKSYLQWWILQLFPGNSMS